MANENENQGQGRQDDFDQQKKDEFGKAREGETGQQPKSGQQGTDGPDSTGGGGFVGSQGQESGEYLQKDKTEQAGFAQQGRGAPDEDTDIERGGERSANLDSDIEGSSRND